MTVQIKTHPAIEPISLAELKDHCRVATDSEDSLLSGYLTAAREFCESVSWRAFVTQTLELRLRRFPRGDEAIVLPRPLFQSLESLKYLVDDELTELDVTAYVVEGVEPATIEPAPHRSWPTVTEQPGAVVATYTAGYGDAADDVPQRIRQAILLLACDFYERRELPAAEVFEAVEALLPSFRDARVMEFV